MGFKMLRKLLALTTALPLAALSLAAAEPGFTELFNGKDFTGWAVNENKNTFSIKDGAIVAHGPRSHCFYTGDFHNHTFRNFELKVDVMTEPGSNGGIYVLTQYQPQSWPTHGFEIQVNNSYKGDPRRTFSIYEVKDVHEVIAPDNQWFTEDILVQGDRITVKYNGKVIADWMQPSDWNGTKDFADRKIAPGTIALQGHDPGSTVHYKNIRIKALD